MKYTREQLVSLWEMGAGAARVTLPSDQHCALVDQAIKMMDEIWETDKLCVFLRKALYDEEEQAHIWNKDAMFHIKENIKLREALMFYADVKNYEFQKIAYSPHDPVFRPLPPNIAWEDHGKIAREALGIEE